MAKFAEEASGWRSGRLVSGSIEEILDWMATYMVHAKKLVLYGKREPSTKREQIGLDDIKRSQFIMGATKMLYINDDNVVFSELAVRTKEWEDLIANMQLEAGFHYQEEQP